MTITYIGSGNKAFPAPGYALYDGSKDAPQFLVEVLEKEIGHRGASVNSIVPTAIEGWESMVMASAQSSEIL
jgi:3-oxoacyl-[acyl-carrier protein] reductase